MDAERVNGHGNMLRYQGRVVIVTGGASGMGRACVEIFGTETIMVNDNLAFIFPRNCLFPY